MDIWDIFGIVLNTILVFLVAVLIFGISQPLFQKLWVSIVLSLVGALITAGEVFMPESGGYDLKGPDSRWR